MSSRHKIYAIKYLNRNGHIRHVLRIGNKAIYQSLEDLGLYPNKSLTIEFPQIPNKYLSSFIRGYFDGDGCVYLYRSVGKKGRLIIRKLSVIFTSGSNKFLMGLLRALRDNLMLKQVKIYNSHRSFQLRFATADSVNIFKFMYKDSPSELFLRRKYDIFQRYFKLKRPSGEVANTAVCKTAIRRFESGLGLKNK
ncbi:MAG: intein-containing protein [Candidatus Nomurabacteria bacterium GW2011_GWB1_37_5]|uniref:Intein-containing protein n=1 Tax=Candidatus Nomurabacteria bacterium GW2011_GWB1_37_5 TaxID=1618742 RepID=A0A0G0GV70_9BACT|nr:MAG: intein-containing protein [Candidatus Nomurabacteria bacterium GW2011_GWB1_37_5]